MLWLPNVEAKPQDQAQCMQGRRQGADCWAEQDPLCKLSQPRLPVNSLCRLWLSWTSGDVLPAWPSLYMRVLCMLLVDQSEACTKHSTVRGHRGVELARTATCNYRQMVQQHHSWQCLPVSRGPAALGCWSSRQAPGLVHRGLDIRCR